MQPQDSKSQLDFDISMCCQLICFLAPLLTKDIKFIGFMVKLLNKMSL